jgi:ABC-2 type transport system ATP-binding protein/lipopolysaccharide transport system ATP-binding protein
MASIRLDDVSVEFRVYQGGGQSLRRTLLDVSTRNVIRKPHSRHVTVRALQDVSLQLDDGDRLGLIGGNGAGKTTLLRVLARIYEANRGRVRIKGRTTPLFDVGFGLDWDSTGYDNIRIRSAYLGIPARQLDAKIEEIVAFTELGEHIHLPMRTYSDGMKLRLAFATATAFDTEILLMDEWIGVSDAHFLERAQERARSFVGRTRIFVIASHLDSVLSSMCNKLLWLDQGRVVMMGALADVLPRYIASTTGGAVEQTA